MATTKPFVGQRVDYYTPLVPHQQLVATVASIAFADEAGTFVNLSITWPAGDVSGRQCVAYLESADGDTPGPFCVSLETPITKVIVLTEGDAAADLAGTRRPDNHTEA